MKYNLSNKCEYDNAIKYLNKLIKKCAKIELKEIRKQRTLQQNAYLHALIAFFAKEQGYAPQELEKCKLDIKTALGYAKLIDGDWYGVSTSAMNTKQLSLFIDKFRMWSDQEMGCYLPQSHEFGFQLQNEVEEYGV